MNIKITAQTNKHFWKPQNGCRSTIKPDIVVNNGKENCIVLDTKWKNLNLDNPLPNDLRQMYVYHEYFGATKVALVYPGNELKKVRGKYLDPISSKELDKECSIINIPAQKNIKDWQKSIHNELKDWMDLPIKDAIL